MDQVQTFENEELSDYVRRFRSVCLFIGPPVNLYFLFLDYQISGEDFGKCLVSRAIMLLSYVAILFYIRKGVPPFIQAVGVGFVLLHIFVVTYIAYTVGGIAQPYSMFGPCILSLATGFLFRSVFILAALNLINFASFMAPGFYLEGWPSTEILLNYLATAATFIVIPSVNAKLFVSSRKSEFTAKNLLKFEIEQRDKIISEKVHEIMTAGDVIKRKDAEINSSLQLGDLAARVAHDIRSPLTALGIVTSDLNSFPEDRRNLVQNAVGRINDIANSLLSYRRNQTSKTEAKSLFAIGPAMDRAVSEKRVERSDQRNVRISYLETLAQYGVFVDLPLRELERHVSNILNNSIEAIGGSGEVKAYIWRSGDEIALRVEDDGPGIPSEVLKNVGIKGFTTSKSGHGLGLFHAKEFLESIGGSLKIESERGRGTIVTLNIPIGKTPLWCLKKLELDQSSSVVVVDDDSPILDVWQKRIPEKKLTYFSDSQSFSNSSLDKSKCIFLVDYEFRNEKINGLELIEKQGIADRTILVTSRFEDSHVLEKAQELGVKILPKNWISIVPIEFK